MLTLTTVARERLRIHVAVTGRLLSPDRGGGVL